MQSNKMLAGGTGRLEVNLYDRTLFILHFTIGLFRVSESYYFIVFPGPHLDFQPLSSGAESVRGRNRARSPPRIILASSSFVLPLWSCCAERNRGGRRSRADVICHRVLLLECEREGEDGAREWDRKLSER